MFCEILHLVVSVNRYIVPFLFYHLERAHPYTEDFLEIAKRYFR